MEIAALGSDATAAGLTPEEQGLTADEAGGELGKSEFLLLLTTQLQNQDPLDPVDNTEMIAQLAQFSALEQMENVNEAIDAGRRENGLVLAGALTGQEVSLMLSDGRQVSGTVEGSSWTSDGACLNVAGTLCALSEISEFAITTGAVSGDGTEIISETANE